MKFIRIIRAWWRNIFRKRRFNMLNATDNSEEWHIHISPGGLFAAFVAFTLLLFILILSLLAYSPVLEFLPGYSTEVERSRESLVQNIAKIDSMERMMNDMLTYNHNMALIMEGKTPVARLFGSADSTSSTKVLVMPSREDSLLRAQMEGDGAYSLAAQSNASRRSIREAIQIIAPAQGIIAEHYDIKNNCFGVRISAPAGAPIVAVDNGTAVHSLWTPEAGYVVEILHGGNMLSVYKGLSQALVVKGQAIRQGETLGYNSESENGEVRLLEFELWSNGKAVDPEEYIAF